MKNLVLPTSQTAPGPDRVQDAHDAHFSLPLRSSCAPHAARPSAQCVVRNVKCASVLEDVKET